MYFCIAWQITEWNSISYAQAHTNITNVISLVSPNTVIEFSCYVHAEYLTNESLHASQEHQLTVNLVLSCTISTKKTQAEYLGTVSRLHSIHDVTGLRPN